MTSLKFEKAKNHTTKGFLIIFLLSFDKNLLRQLANGSNRRKNSTALKLNCTFLIDSHCFVASFIDKMGHHKLLRPIGNCCG
jgi:hypothetical protein